MSKNLAVAYAVKRKAKGKADKDNFLSAEGAEPETFLEGPSDEEELEASGFLPDEPLDNESGNDDQVKSRAETIAEIMRRMRK